MKQLILTLVLAVLTSCTSSAIESELPPSADSPPMSSGLEMVAVQFKPFQPSHAEALARASLLDAFAEDALERNLQTIMSNKSVRFEILGFTDASECAGQNCIELSGRRARSVYDWLVRRGVDPPSIADVKGRGSSFPLDMSGTDETKSLNRRVEINVIP